MEQTIVFSFLKVNTAC